MKPPKLGLIILILGLTALGAYFLTLIPKDQAKQSSVSSPSVKLSSSAPTTPFLSLGNFDEKKNLTKNLGEALYQEIQTEKLFADADVFSEKLTDKVINNSLAEFQLVFFIDDSEIKISSDNSREAKNQYLKTLGEINVKNFGDFKKNYLEVIVDTYQKLDYSSADRLANIYKNLANDYSNLAVPKDWVDFHKQLIIYAENAAITYRALANYPTDPLKGGIPFLTGTIETLVNNAGDIQNIFSEKIKEIDFQ